MFPMFVNMQGRDCLVVGAGAIGEAKIAGLVPTGAHIRVVALQATEKVRDWAQNGEIVLHERAFTPADLEGAFLAVVATSHAELNRRVFSEAQRRGVLCNVVDVPQLCDFFYPAVVRRGDLQIAVSTSGQSPTLAQIIRDQIAEQIDPGYAGWVAELGQTRRRVLASNLDPDQKRRLLKSLASPEAFEAALAAAEPELKAVAS
jgi:precorrin-2 dehydrogenase/sirohydrochlorin ferrochelatase